MGTYIEYSYYECVYGGSLIPETDFKGIATKASNKINYYTVGNIEKNNIPNEVKNASCEVAELLYKQELLKTSISNNNDNQIASETLGPRSITYLNNNAEISKQILNDNDLNKKIYHICHEYLDNTGLMDRGVYE